MIEDLGSEPFLLKGHIIIGDNRTPISFFLDIGRQRFIAEMPGLTIFRRGRTARCREISNSNDNWFEALKSFRLISEIATDRIYLGSWSDPFTRNPVTAVFTIRQGQLKLVTEFHANTTIDVYYSEKVTDKNQLSRLDNEEEYEQIGSNVEQQTKSE